MSILWQRCLERLETELTPEEIHTWLKPLQAVDGTGELRLLAPNTFVMEAASERFGARIEEVAKHLDARVAQVRFEVGSLAGARRPAHQPSIGGVSRAQLAASAGNGSITSASQGE